MAERVGIDIEATDDTAAAFESARKNVEDLGSVAERSSFGFEAMAQSAEKSARTVEHGMSMLTRLDLVQITVEQSSNRVQQAQEKYNQAVAQFGQQSDKAVAASRELESAQAALEKANLRAELSMGLVVVQGLSMAAQIPAAVASLTALGASASTAAVALGTLQVIATVGAAAIGITAGLVALSSALGSVGASAGATGSQFSSLASDVAQAEAKVRSLQQAIKDEPLADLQRALAPELKQSLQELSEAEHQLAQARVALSEQYQGELVREQTLQHGSIDLLVSYRNNYAAVRDELQKKLSSGTLDPSAFDQARAGLEAVEGNYKKFQDRIDTITKAMQTDAEAAGRATEQMAQRMAGSLAQAIPGFDQLSLAMQRTIAEGAGIDASLLPSIQRLTDFEGKLQGQTQATRDEMLKQAAAARDKSGAHQVLDAALQDGTITETEYQRAVAASEAAMNRQRGAASSNAAAFGAQSAYDAQFSAGLSQDQGGYTRTLSGRIDPGAQGGGGYDARAQGVADQVSRYLSRNPQDPAGLRQWQTFLDVVAHGGGGGATLSNPGLLQALRQAGIVTAAQGFDGQVTQPTMFLAGEAGPEQVRITPNGGGGGGNTTLNLGGVNLHFHGQATESAVRRGLAGAVRDLMTIPQMRVASGRAM